MKLTLLLIMFAMASVSWSQQKTFVKNKSYTLTKFLAVLETKFDVKYSYADKLLAMERIKIPSKNYNLAEFHQEIEAQTNLQVIKISERYYAISLKEMPTMKFSLDEIVVSGFLSKGITKHEQVVTISPDKVEELPGVTDADLLLSLQQLPGVKSPNETATGLHVRGGTPDQNLILWDGIRMYHPGHLFGMISAYNPNVKQTVNYLNKATDPKFGERTASVIEIKPTSEIAPKFLVYAGINSLDANLYVRAPLIIKKLGIQVSARKSITEWIQTPTFISLAKKVFQNTNLTNFNEQQQLGFYDCSLKLNYKVNDNNDLSVTGIAIDNALDFTTSDINAEFRNQKMNIRNYGSSFNWNKKYNSKFTHQLLLHYSAFSLEYERIQRETNSVDAFEKQNRLVDSGAEINFNYTLSESLNLAFGYQLNGNDISHSFTSRTPNLIIELDQKQNFNVSNASYFNLKYGNDGWNVHGGMRYNNFVQIQENSFEPRIFIQKSIAKKYFWQLTYESKSQAASQVRESVVNDLSLENYVWILADEKQYPLQKAQQFTTGFIYKSKPISIDIDFYYKTLKGITSMTFGFLNQTNASVNRGQGFTKGVDLLLQKNAPSWRLWLTYTYQDSQNRYTDLNNGKYFPISSEITHAMSLSYFKKWGNYSISTGWFLHSGRPYSQIDESNEIATFNNLKLPAHHRLNISGAYQLINQKSWNGRVGFSIYNAYNKRSIISREYERQYTEIGDISNSRYILRNYYSLGFTPNLFARINF